MSLRILSEADVLSTLHGSEPQGRLTPIVDFLAEQFRSYLTDEEVFNVTYQKGSCAFLLTVSLMGPNEQGTIFDFYVADQTKMELVNGCPSPILDFLGHALDTFFKEERDARLPLDFTPFNIEKTDVYARQAYRKLDIERQADAWLKKAGEF